MGKTVTLHKFGDFFEAIGPDAADVAKTLGITLSSRKGVPMCGVPYHRLTDYIAGL